MSTTNQTKPDSFSSGGKIIAPESFSDNSESRTKIALVAGKPIMADAFAFFAYSCTVLLRWSAGVEQSNASSREEEELVVVVDN